MNESTFDANVIPLERRIVHRHEQACRSDSRFLWALAGWFFGICTMLGSLEIARRLGW
jgi:hypothetical protein